MRRRGERSPLAPCAASCCSQRASSHRGFAQTETTTPEDKQVLQQYLEAECPEGMAGVDRLLLQASMLSDRFVTPGFAQYHGAEDLAVKALDKWLER